MNAVSSRDFAEFALNNRVKVNRYLNVVLWLFVLTGPAIALGVKLDLFKEISYRVCLDVSLLVAVMSGIHLILFKKFPNFRITSFFALTALDILIAYMGCKYVNIHIIWFLVPLLSLLYCDWFIYFYSIILNYILLIYVTKDSANYFSALRNDYEFAELYFKDALGGYTIEMLIMLVAGLILLKLASGYFREIFRQYEVIKEQEKSVNEKVEILDSMAEIYDNVNLISFIDNTEMPLRDIEQGKHGIDMNTQTHTLMNQRIKKQVLPEQLDDFMEFTNIKTVRSRLKGKKLISKDFIDVNSGWFRAQYITVDSTLDGIPNVIIYTTHNVDEEKRREETLRRLSLTDELTRLQNRRSFDENLKEYREKGLDEDLTIFSIDVNGLKAVNDTKGHAAGDEYIIGATECLSAAVGKVGRVYRTGGDEFMAIVHMKEPEALREAIAKQAGEWHGTYTDTLTMSVGYASVNDHPGATVDDLEHLADADMYAEKERYYKESGKDRRRY